MNTCFSLCLQQRILGCTEEGGCPFSHWDDTALSTELSRLGLLMPDIADILSLRGAGQFSAACQRCLRSTHLSRAHWTESVEAENMSLQSDCKAEHPSCHQVLISSSPDNLYRTDCGASDELGVSNEVKDTENVLEVQRVKSSGGRPRMPVSGRVDGVRKMGETPETTLTVMLREQRICKRTSRVVNSLEVCARKRSHISESETSAYSVTTFQKVVKASSSKCSHALSNPKCCKTLPDGMLVCPSEHEHAQTGSLAQDQPAANSEAQAELKESCLWYFDHAVCPSQQAQGQSSSTNSSPSVDILKPVQYFQLSYQRLLESLKS